VCVNPPDDLKLASRSRKDDHWRLLVFFDWYCLYDFQLLVKRDSQPFLSGWTDDTASKFFISILPEY